MLAKFLITVFLKVLLLKIKMAFIFQVNKKKMKKILKKEENEFDEKMQSLLDKASDLTNLSDSINKLCFNVKQAKENVAYIKEIINLIDKNNFTVKLVCISHVEYAIQRNNSTNDELRVFLTSELN